MLMFLLVIMCLVFLVLGLEIGYRQALHEIEKGFVSGYYKKSNHNERNK